MQMIGRPNPAARIGGFAAVLLFHALLIYFLVTGLGKQAVQMVAQPIQALIVREQPVLPPSPPPPPAPQITAPPPFIPLPDIRMQVPPPPMAITAPPSPKPPPKQDFKPSPAPAPTQVAPSPAPAAPPAPAPVRTGASRIASAGCDVPEKPAASDRLGEMGTVTISVTIGPNGSVTQSSVASSSGFKRLDDAALAAIGLCRFRPATVDGKPEASTSAVRYHSQ